MPGEIKIQYEAVYEKASQLRGRIESQLGEMDAAHRKILAMLSGMDGATNAQLIEAIKSNSAKARVAGETLGKLLSFIANSSRQVEIQERAVAGSFQQEQ